MEANGKVVIVTGAGRGIGRQIALALAGIGYKVVAAARTLNPDDRRPGTIADTVATIESRGGTALAVQADVAKPDDLQRLVATTVEHFGRLDVVINNAANTTATSAPLDEFPLEKWLNEFQTNVHGPFTLMALVIPELRKQGGGIIINITSDLADIKPVDPESIAHAGNNVGNALGYATTKAALNRLTNGVAPGLASENIAALCLDPGYTLSEIVETLGQQGIMDTKGAHPMRIPVDAVVKIVLAADPLQYSGQIVRAANLINTSA